jgi:hypothetical protein
MNDQEHGKSMIGTGLRRYLRKRYVRYVDKTFYVGKKYEDICVPHEYLPMGQLSRGEF